MNMQKEIRRQRAKALFVSSACNPPAAIFRGQIDNSDFQQAAADRFKNPRMTKYAGIFPVGD